jgi:hypothetical protein
VTSIEVVASLNLASDPDLGELFEACRRLENFLLEQFPHGQRLGPRQPEAPMWFTTMRGMKTLDAILLLCDAGYGNQAVVLSRTLFEDAVVTLWLSTRPEVDLIELIGTHEKSVAAALQRDQPGRAYFSTVAGLPALPDTDWERFVQEYAVNERRATELWTTQNVFKMVTRVRAHGNVNDTILDRAFGIGYKLQNIFVHNSPASAGSAVSGASPRAQIAAGHGAFVLSRQPSKLLVQDALSLSYHSLALLAGQLRQPNAASALDAILETDMPRFVCLSKAEQRTGRNEPCPCGSGRKFKLCHGTVKAK